MYMVVGFRENLAQALSGRQKFTQAGSLCWQKCNAELSQQVGKHIAMCSR